MSCEACRIRVEKAVNAVPGVDSCAVNLLTKSMGVEGSARPETIISAVEAAGYGAALKGSGSEKASLPNAEISGMKKRLIASVLFLLPLMYVSMGHMLWDWPLPAFLDGNHVAMGIYELLLSGMVMVINRKFFISGFKGLFHRSPNMDTLVALGSGASFGYSVFALFAMTGAVLENDAGQITYYMEQFYFEAAAMILTLITVGKTLEERSKGKTTNALKGLMEISPKTAAVIRNGVEITIPAAGVKVGDRFVIRPGDSIPVDGVVIEGESAVNESALTGESVPAEKKVGDGVSAATINTSGYMVCEATRVGEDTTLSAIIKMVSDAAATKAPIAKIADRVSGVFVPIVIGIALVTFLVWMLFGVSVGYAMARGVSVLVISCPCALGLATPVAIMVGNGVSAKTGILFKTAASLELAGKTQIIAIDKTGTITTGVMRVTDIEAADGVSDDELIRVAYALESKSEHPISGAVKEYAAEKKVRLEETSDFEALSGNGLRARLGGEMIYGGNLQFIESITGEVPEEIRQKEERLAGEGKTPVLIAENNGIMGILGVSDVIRDDTPAAISELKKLGIHVVMLTGDNEVTAAAIAGQAGVDEFAASLKPGDKEAVIGKLKEHGTVTMVGDGINDAPALTSADLGIAIGAGTDVAMDAADVVLMKNSIRDVAAAVRISRSTLRNIRENLFWAFFYNVLGIPLAAGCYIAAFGWEMSPVFGAAAMGLSSLCVVSNALRLNRVRPYDGKKDRSVKNAVSGSLLIDRNNADKGKEDCCASGVNEKETLSGEKRLKGEKRDMKITVKGMMCGHCEAHVKKALEAIDGIDNVTASHDENLVTFTNSMNVDESVIKAAVENAGYEYAGVRSADD